MAKIRHYSDSAVVITAICMVLATLGMLRLATDWQDRVFPALTCLIVLVRLALDYEITRKQSKE